MKTMTQDTRGVISAKEIVSIAIALLVTAIVLPIALEELGSVDSENWGSAASTLVTLIQVLLPVIAIVSIVLKFTGRV